jgi:PAS domain S-box-containing protein
MNWQTILYFTSILVTCALTGFLAWQAWKQKSVGGSRYYSWLALAMCAVALEEAFSMLSPTQALALFWFKTRFLPLAAIPPLWFLFVLEYSGRRNRLSKGLVAGLLAIPLITQVMVWTSGLHTLWVLQDVGFRQDFPFWIAEIGTRIPGLWFLVHTFYAQMLILAGSVLLLRAAWRTARLYRLQAAFLAASALVPMIVAVVTTFNLLPREALNPTVPGLGLAAALAAAAVFRFDFLKKAPAPEDTMRQTDAQEKRAQTLLLLIFGLMVTGIAAVGYLSYRDFAKQFRAQMEGQLTAIASLKVGETENWRAERVGDAEVLAQNAAFSGLVQRCLDDPADAQARAQLQSWLDSMHSAYQYNHIFLLDTGGQMRISSPAGPVTVPEHPTGDLLPVLQSKQVTFLDFHRHTDGEIYLALLVPIYAEQEPDRLLGVLVMEIDPAVYLYPYLEQWPAPSTSAETLLVRRDGEEVLYLNPLRYQPEAALTLRIPLTDTDILAVKAVLGETGVVEGTDYRGQAVIGAVGAVPGSPWFLVARMDAAEVYAPLRARLWQTIIFFGMLIAASGTGLVLVWRQQRVRYYRARFETAEAQRNSEIRYRRLFEAARDGILILDAESGVIVDVNPFLIEMLGFSKEEICGKELWELGFFKDVAECKANFLELQEKEYIRYEDLPLETVGGRKFHVEFVSNVYQVNHHKVIQCNVRDITERKQAEDALRESEDKFKYIFEYSMVGKSITRFNGGMQVNKALCDMVGYSPQEMQDKKWQEITHPDDIELTQNQINLLLSGEKESVRFVKRFIHKNGSIVWVDLNSTIRRDAQRKPLYLMSAVIDITERKQAEEKLIASEVRYRRLFEAARNGILILDADTGVVVDVNPFLVEMLGFSHEVFLGKEIWELGFFKDIAANKAKFLELQRKDHIRYENLPMETADGRSIDVEFVGNVYQMEHRRVYQCNIRDITERKQAEQKLTNYTDHLEEIVDERTRELRTVHEQLVRQERLAMLGQVAGSIGHELRNPLGVISNAIYFLKTAQPGANDTVKEYLDIIEKETRTSDKIITDLLDFTRVKSVDREAVSVSELIRQTLERFPAPPAVKVSLKIPKRLPQVYADPKHAVQILGNLVANACQAMPKGGNLSISAGAPNGDMIKIAVRDTGTGVLPENMSKLFEPLFTTKTTGIGLGLAVSRKLAEANGGRIEVQSEPGKGSTFTLVLPVYSS